MPITYDDAQGGASEIQGVYDYDAPYALGPQEAEVLWAEENYKDRGKSHRITLGLRGKLTDGYGLYDGSVADGVGCKVDYYPPMRGKRIGEILETFGGLAREDGLHLADTRGHRCTVVVEAEEDKRDGGVRPRIKSVGPLPATQPAQPTSAPNATADYMPY